MKDELTHYSVPLFMILLAAGMLILAHKTGNESLKTFADGVGGGGLTLLTAAARNQTTNKITGGPVTIDQTPQTTTTTLQELQP